MSSTYDATLTLNFLLTKKAEKYLQDNSNASDPNLVPLCGLYKYIWYFVCELEL